MFPLGWVLTSLTASEVIWAFPDCPQIPPVSENKNFFFFFSNPIFSSQLLNTFFLWKINVMCSLCWVIHKADPNHLAASHTLAKDQIKCSGKNMRNLANQIPWMANFSSGFLQSFSSIGQVCSHNQTVPKWPWLEKQAAEVSRCSRLRLYWTRRLYTDGDRLKYQSANPKSQQAFWISGKNWGQSNWLV